MGVALEVTLMLLGTIIWIGCGFLGYGLIKNFWKEFYSKTIKNDYFRLDNEGICITAALTGPGGLAFALIVSLLARWLGKYPIRFCYRIPKELCRKRNK